MTSEKRLAELTDLESVLDTFGADPTRWPDAKRGRLIALAAADIRARQLVREAEALDAVLARAGGGHFGDTTAFADRIAAAVAGTRAPVQADKIGPERLRTVGDEAAAGAEKPGVVIAWPGAQVAATAPRAATPTGSAPRRDRPMTQWRTAAALAASLVLGVFVGAMDFVPSGFSGLVPGIEASADTPRELALLQGDDLLDFLDERAQ